MPTNSYTKEAQLDSRVLGNLALPYDRITGELQDSPRLVRGLNMMATTGGKLVKRPGTIEVSNSFLATSFHRLITYETIEATPKVYQLASTDTGVGSYILYWRDPDAVSPTWTSVGTLRQTGASTHPHEMVVHKGKVYIKSFPTTASSEKLGTTVFQIAASSATLKPWGILPPTEPAHIAAPGSWTTTTNAHTITVRVGWRYAYAWVSSTGQVSSISPLETNPDKNPSDTGAFTFAASAGKCPEVVVQGLADTTNFPSIRIYRTLDGGGTFYFIKTITNTGAGNITYVDDDHESGASGGTFADPVPDSAIDVTDLAPDTVSNDPPPSVPSPLVVGTDTPERGTHLISWQGRIWYALRNFVYYSSVEEIDDGIGEECFRSGLLGNFFEVDALVTGFSKTKNFLLVHTTKNTYIVTGSTKDTFDIREFLGNVGGALGYGGSRFNECYTPVGENAAWLTNDYRVALVDQNADVRILSDALFTDISDETRTATGAPQSGIQLLHFTAQDKNLLFVMWHDRTLAVTATSKQWVLDFNLSKTIDRPFWNVPWNLKVTTACVGKLVANDTNQRLLFGSALPNSSNGTRLSRWDSTGRTGTDNIDVGGAAINQGFDWFADFWLMPAPTGNHLNQISIGHRTPTCEKVLFDRMLVPQDDDPIVYYYLDDFWSTPIQGRGLTDLPERRRNSKTYKTFGVNVQEVCNRAAFRIQRANDQRLFELHNMTVIWKP